MPAITSNIGKFSYTSDFPSDKIVYLLEDDYVLELGSDVRIPHNLTFTPLIILQWSLSADFSIAYEANTGPFPSGNVDYVFKQTVVAETDSDDIILRSNGVEASFTAYIRIFGFAPSDFDGDTPNTASIGDKFVYNSDNNYMKLIDADKVEVASGSSVIIPHSLGIIPHVMAWAEYDGVISHISLSWPMTGAYVEPKNDSIIIHNDSFIPYTVHYRMYYDE